MIPVTSPATFPVTSAVTEAGGSEFLDQLLQEDGFALLLEDGSFLLLE